ncbi:MAG: hypothetical protein GX623_02815 [Clostridiales bacterium]|nr:hypothetical protein [Clostridiales bacterium]
MGKRCGIALMAVLLALCLAPSAQGMGAAYLARVRTEFSLRQRPDDGARRVRQARVGDALEVLEYGAEWSKVRLEKKVGYARTRFLWMFRLEDSSRYPVPGAPERLGAARMTLAADAAVDGYRGNSLQPDDRVAVARMEGGQAVVPMMRSFALLPPGAFELAEYVPWDEAQPGDLVGGATTFYNQYTGGKLGANRQENIALASARVSAIVLKPGETFSFNAVTGPYRRSNGYKMAPSIGGDGSSEGGGVCQVSTTLLQAVLGVPARITQWELHQQSGVRYAPAGLDAAVGAYSDFEFTNILPYALRLEALPQNGALSVWLYRADAE